jgi:hypothetical protein
MPLAKEKYLNFISYPEKNLIKKYKYILKDKLLDNHINIIAPKIMDYHNSISNL